MQIKEFARETGLPAKTIRYYEEIGLLPQPRRLENGYRVYDGTEVARARLVAGARTLDFSLDDIARLLTDFPHVCPLWHQTATVTR